MIVVVIGVSGGGRGPEPCLEGDNSQVTTSAEGQTFYDAIGGYPTIAKIVDRFYEGVATDEVLRPLYPEQDLTAAAERFTMFLEQYWGGPTTYSQRRGHPRLRVRHPPFAIGPVERDAWLTHMRAAGGSLDLSAEQDATLWGYLEMAARSMQNRFADDAAGDLSP